METTPKIKLVKFARWYSSPNISNSLLDFNDRYKYLTNRCIITKRELMRLMTIHKFDEDQIELLKQIESAYHVIDTPLRLEKVDKDAYHALQCLLHAVDPTETEIRGRAAVNDKYILPKVQTNRIKSDPKLVNFVQNAYRLEKYKTWHRSYFSNFVLADLRKIEKFFKDWNDINQGKEEDGYISYNLTKTFVPFK